MAEFGASSASTLDELLDDQIDLLIGTPRPARAPYLLDTVLKRDVACFMNKTIACSMAQLESIGRMADELKAPFFTSSVLRFAPALEEYSIRLADQQLLSLHCEVQHEISPFLTVERSWQDDPEGAGGTMLNMGIHGWEMIDVALNGAPLSVTDARATRADPARTRSEDAATVLAITDDGIPVSLRISGTGGKARYSLHATTTTGPLDMELPGDDPTADHGYARLAEVLIDLPEQDVAPIPWARTYRLYENMILAAEKARSLHPDWYQTETNESRQW